MKITSNKKNIYISILSRRAIEMSVVVTGAVYEYWSPPTGLPSQPGDRPTDTFKVIALWSATCLYRVSSLQRVTCGMGRSLKLVCHSAILNGANVAWKTSRPPSWYYWWKEVRKYGSWKAIIETFTMFQHNQSSVSKVIKEGHIELSIWHRFTTSETKWKGLWCFVAEGTTFQKPSFDAICFRKPKL